LAVIGKKPKSRIETAISQERRKPNSVFNSTTNRFNLTYNAANINVRLLTSNAVTRDKKAMLAIDNRGYNCLSCRDKKEC